LLDPGVLVERVDGDVDAAGDDLGLEHPGSGSFRAGADLSTEDDLNGVRAAQVQVVADQGLDEGAGMAGGVEDHGVGDLDLAHRELPPVAADLVDLGQRGRQDVQPAVDEGLDLR
jgi:hypothetical protein